MWICVYKNWLLAIISFSSANDNSEIDPIEAASLLKDSMRKQKIGHPDKQGRTPIHAAALRGAIISLMDLADVSCTASKIVDQKEWRVT